MAGSRAHLTVPEASRLTTWCRRQFASRLAGALGQPSWASIQRPAAYWLDHRDCLNHARVTVYRTPCCQDPRAPLILRIAVNLHAVDHPGRVVRRMAWRPPLGDWDSFVLGAGWSFELSALPEEILDFVPWVAFLAWAHEGGATRFLKAPHPCHFWGGEDDLLQCRYAWTRAAWAAAEAHDRRRNRRKGAAS